MTVNLEDMDDAAREERIAALVDGQNRARRRAAAALGALTKAEKTGSPTAIAAAHQKVDDRWREFRNISDAAISELAAHVDARLTAAANALAALRKEDE